MNHYQELSSTKYLREKVKQENQELHRQKQRSNLKALAFGAAGILVLLVSFYAMPIWITVIVNLLDFMKY